MLGRTANGIVWMYRYLERAENTARLLDAGFRMALTRSQAAAQEEWRSVLVASELDDEFRKHHDDYSGPAVFNFVLRSPENPANVLNMMEWARMNARTVRTALTREVWEATNESWMTLREVLARPVRPSNLGDVLATIRRQSTKVRGATEGTMLRNEIFNFSRIGTFLERADNTARILDVKYHVLLPSVGWVGSTLDNAQWESVLRSLAAERAYRWLNAGSMDARGIARFLILDGRFPRSIAFCYEKLRSNMASLAREYGQETSAHEYLRDAVTRLHQTSTEEIFEFGLHEFIVTVLERVARIADEIAADYRFDA